MKLDNKQKQIIRCHSFLDKFFQMLELRVLLCLKAVLPAGLSASEARAKPFIASMGIYVFKKELLVNLLKEKYTKSNDFGGEIIQLLQQITR